MASKKELRNIFLEKRMFLSEKEYQLRNSLIQKHIAYHIDFKKYTYLHTFLSISDKKEVLTAPIIQLAKSQQPDITVMTSKTLPQCQLAHYIYDDNTQIKVNKWGIPEPTNANTVAADEVDLVLVPLLSFDREGHRIGYGKGYYDRFLKTIPNALKVGVSLAPPLDHIPYSDAMDVRLDCCITPFSIYSF